MLWKKIAAADLAIWPSYAVSRSDCGRSDSIEFSRKNLGTELGIPGARRTIVGD